MPYCPSHSYASSCVVLLVSLCAPSHVPHLISLPPRLSQGLDNDEKIRARPQSASKLIALIKVESKTRAAWCCTQEGRVKDPGRHGAAPRRVESRDPEYAHSMVFTVAGGTCPLSSRLPTEQRIAGRTFLTPTWTTSVGRTLTPTTSLIPHLTSIPAAYIFHSLPTFHPILLASPPCEGVTQLGRAV